MSKQVIVITGASSGFGALTARALAVAGHTVYAGMRATEGRNAAAVADAAEFAKDNNVDLRSVELDVASDASVVSGIARLSPMLVASMSSSTMPAICPSARQKPSRRNSSPSSSTSTCSPPSV